MPEQTNADLATIRARPIGRDFQFFVYQPVILATLTIGGAPATGDRTLTTSTDSGDPTDAIADQTCRVTTAAGASKIKPSKVRFKSWAGNVLTVAENAIEWVVGDKVYIVRLWEIWPRVPWFNATTGEQKKDRTITWVDDATAQPPKANAGPTAIATLSSGTVDVTFKSYLSWSTLAPLPNLLPFLLGEDADFGGPWSFECPVGAVPTGGQTWAALGGSPTIAAGGVSASFITYRYNAAGYYYVSLTVTDGNGKTGVRYVPVIIDDGTLAQSYTVPGDRSGDARGWRLSRSVESIAAEADDANWYDGAPCFAVADASGASVRAFAGNRQNLRWSGWLKEDNTRRDAYSRGVAFRAVSTNDILANIPAYPTAFRSDVAPADWYEFSQLSIDSVVYLLLRWHSTADIVTDYFPMSETAWTTRLRPGENCRGQDLLSQINYVLKAAKADLRCDRQGTLRAMRDEWYLSAAELAARDAVMTLTLADIQSVDYGPSPHQARTREVRLDGVDGASTPFLSGAPGAAPLDGGHPEEEKNLAPLTQAELDQWSGQQLAIENWQVPLTVKMAGEYDVFDPAIGERLLGSLSSLDTRIPDGPYSIKSVSFEDDSERGVTISTLRLLSDPGQYEADARPLPSSAPAPPSPPVLPDLPPVEVDEPFGTGERCGVAGQGGFFYSGDARTGAPPTWTAYNTGLADATFIKSLCADPRRSTYAACIDESGAVFVTTDWFGGSAWTSVLTEGQATALIEAADAAITLGPTIVTVNAFAKSTDETGVLLATVNYRTGASDDKTRVLFSTDWGANWTCGGQIPGFIYLAVTYYGYTIKEKDKAPGFTANAGAGELTFDGVNIILCARSMRDNALAAAAFNFSSDWGVTWQASAITQQGGGNGSSGPLCARVLSTGTLIMTWWRLLAGGANDHVIGSTADLAKPIATVTSLTGTAPVNEYAVTRGMFDVLTGDDRAELFVDGSDTDIYVNGVLSDTIVGVECRTVQGFSEDGDFILVLRSWFNADIASGGDETVLYRSTDQGDNFADASGNLYALGCRSGTAVIFDWVSDV